MKPYLDIDAKEVASMFTAISKKHEKAMYAALRGEAYRLNLRIKEYARTTKWPVSETTKVFRKNRGGYGSWFARMSRYAADYKTLTAHAGILDPGTPGMRAKAWSAKARSMARKHATGYTFRQTRARQKAMYRSLYMATTRSGRRKYTHTKLASMTRRQVVPRVGIHRVPARPIAGKVAMREQSRSVRNVLRLYRMKMRGYRWDNTWMQKWGNQ